MFSSFSTLKAIASILSIATVANAHMKMKTPIPYGKATLNNSPLAADGSDYPCKGIFDMSDPTNDVNHLVPGVSNTLSFIGGATHGGGSCQVALTNDLKPTKSSKWMVIKSIEGGCPNSAPGNIGTDANADDPTTFQYTVPEGFPEGQYTISWTWFNKVGNREMYMNCGRANIANSKKRYAPAQPKVEHRAADYPDIFKAQLSIFSDCKVPEGINIKFPNGGPDVETVLQATLPQGCGGSSGGSSPNPVSGGSSGPAASSSVAATASRVAGSSSSSAPAAGNPGPTGGFAHGSQPSATPSVVPGNFGPKSSSSAAAATNAPQASASVVPFPSSPAASSAAGSAPAQPTPSSSSGGNTSSPAPATGATTAGTKCSDEGAWACSSDGTSFQRCASGYWSASMKVAAGTTCTPGQSMNLSMKVVSGGYSKKRSVGSSFL